MLGGQQWIANVVTPPSFAVWPTWDTACQQHRWLVCNSWQSTAKPCHADICAWWHQAYTLIDLPHQIILFLLILINKNNNNNNWTKRLTANANESCTHVHIHVQCDNRILNTDTTVKHVCVVAKLDVICWFRSTLFTLHQHKTSTDTRSTQPGHPSVGQAEEWTCTSRDISDPYLLCHNVSWCLVEIVPERVLVLFQARTSSLRSGLGTQPCEAFSLDI